MEKALLMGMHRAAFPDNGMRSIGSEYYRWKICENPVKEGFIYLEEKEGKIVGSSTAMPRKLILEDGEAFGAELGDSFTLPEYRRQGINFKALKGCMEYALSLGMDLIYGPPNRANYGIHIKLGFQPCAHIGWALLTKSLNPVETSVRLIGRMIRGKDIRANLRHLEHLARKRALKGEGAEVCRSREENDFQIVAIDRFTERVDPLWGKPRYSFFVRRDSRYLNWRYFDSPDKFRVLAAVRDEEYLGFIAVKITKDHRRGIICDFVTVNDRGDVFRTLVMEAERIVRENGAKVIILRCIAHSPYYDELKRLGYYDPGQDRYQPVLIFGKTELGRRILENPGKWHFTFGDTDEV